MRADQRIVTRLPIRELWDATGTLAGGRIRYLDRNMIAELLRKGPVEFVIADCGLHLKWIPADERFTFWKTMRDQISNPGNQFSSTSSWAASRTSRLNGKGGPIELWFCWKSITKVKPFGKSPAVA
jgi:hypothetical protein